MARRILRGGRFLLAALILLMLAFPALEEATRPILLIAFIGAVFVAGVMAVDPGTPHVRFAVAVTLVQIMSTAAAVATSDESLLYRGSVTVTLGTMAVLIVYCIYCVLRYVLQATRISRDQIYAGISVYLMLGFAFGCLYYLISMLHPGSFAVNTAALAQRSGPDLMYFSFVTLATLGYGDITPVAKTARALAELEAVAGTLYMAVFMARLVTLAGVANPLRVSADSRDEKAGATPSSLLK